MKNALRNWSDVRVFLAVVREGSTLAASRKLGVAQPTVARRIEVLEKEIGLTLFERDTRGFRPTEAARLLFPLAEAIEDATDTFVGKSRELTRRKPIRITAPGTFSDRVTDLFSEFVALNPGVSFEFVPSIKVLNLSEGEADIAFRIAYAEPDESLICRTISTAKWALFGSQNYADRFGFPKSLDDLQGHRFVTFQNDDVPDYLHGWLIKHVTPDQIVMSFSELDLMHASIRTGQGLGLVNLRIADTDAALVQCSEVIEALSRKNMMLIAPDAYRRAEVKAFVKYFAPRYAKFFR